MAKFWKKKLAWKSCVLTKQFSQTPSKCAFYDTHDLHDERAFYDTHKLQGAYSSEYIKRALRLYAVTDSTHIGARSLASCVNEAIAGGVTFVQLREKNASFEEKLSLAKEIFPLCARAKVPFVIDDDIEVARACDTDGVHVGQSDATCAYAREILGPNKIVGVSAQTLEQALAAQDAGADYLGVGALFATPTKPDASLVSLETFIEICKVVSIPVVAIGGINAQTISSLANTGAAGAAVVSAIFAAQDTKKAAQTLRTQIDEII